MKNLNNYSTETSSVPLKQLWRYTMLLVVGLFISFSSKAQLSSTYCDGNPSDWANFQTVYPIKSYTLDTANAVNPTDDNFKSAKDVNDLNNWSWWPKGANDKGDITNAGAVLTGTNNCILRFFGDRTDVSGASNIGFWFFKNEVSKNANGTFTPNHADGDLLIVVSLTQGGVLAVPKVYQWVTGTGLVEITTAASFACSGANAGPSDPIPAGLTYTNKDGNSIYQKNAFFEGAIDLCGANLGNCFASFLVETRQSPSKTAALEDFALGAFNATPSAPSAQGATRCGPGTVSLTASGCAGGTLKWYTAATGGTPVGTGSPFTPNITATTDYWVSCTIGTCEGPRTKVTGIVVPIPPAPGVSIVDASVCGPSTATVTVTCPLNPASGPAIYQYKNGGDPNEEAGWTTNPVFGSIAAGAGFSIRVRLISNPTCYSAATTCTNYVTNTANCVQPTASSNTTLQNSSSASSLSSVSTDEIKEVVENRDITAYPVPFRSKVNVDFKSERSGNYAINLYDSKGKLIKELKTGKSKAGQLQSIEVDGRSLSDGMYFIRVVDDAGSRTVKLLKKE